MTCLKGESAYDLRVRNNNRSYYGQGVEQLADVRFDTGGADHEVSVGLRYHRDEEDRFQNDDLYNQTANGTITGFTPGAPGSQDNRVEAVKALAAFVQDRIRMGPWQFIPGVRFETLDYSRTNRATGVSGDASLNMLGGGLGVIYDWNPPL